MKVSPAGSATELVASGAGGLLATLGLALSADGRTLWAGSVGIPQMAGYTATDSGRGVIYRVPRSGDTLEVFAESPLLCSPQQPAESADGKWLYVPDYCHGMLAVNTGRPLGRPPLEPD